MSTTRVREFALCGRLPESQCFTLMSVVESANASDTRQPVNKQMPNSTLSLPSGFEPLMIFAYDIAAFTGYSYSQLL